MKYVAVSFLVLMMFASAVSADFPGAVRIAADGDAFVAGVQLAPGGEGSFELFAGRTGEQAIHPLGRFNGRLAGVAVDADGKPLALTRDGSLTRHGDDLDALALPDSRWRMQALAMMDGKPVAVSLDNNEFRLVRPGANLEWVEDPLAAARSDAPARIELVPLGADLHLLWAERSDQLDGGLIRHALFRGGLWTELPPLIAGNAVGFCAYPAGDGIDLAILAADPLGSGPEHASGKHWRDGKWSDTSLSAEIRNTLESQPFSFAAAAAPGGDALLLSSGVDGAVLRRDIDGVVGKSTLAPPPENAGVGIAPRFTSLISIIMICLLLVIYCKRSRKISLAHPERVPDMISRGAALGIDWMIASLAMGAYHVASGDVRILPDLMRLGHVQGIFWANLAGLAFFMFLSEAAFGSTPGKYLAGLRVASLFGGKPGVLQAGLRNALRALDMYPFSGTLPGVVGAVAAFMNRGRQRIGDMVAGTAVRRHLGLDKRGILLASASPRRHELLGELGVPVRVEIPDIDEDSIKGSDPRDTVRLLAEAKAKAMLERAKPPELVVAADTVVVLDGQVMGKPVDADDAVRMLKKLSGRSHSVFTGVTVWDPASGRGMTDVEETEVEFRELSDAEIAAYVATGDPLDKAGAYGVQTGHLVKQIRGSLSNVAGLPMEKLQSMIDLLGV